MARLRTLVAAGWVTATIAGSATIVPATTAPAAPAAPAKVAGVVDATGETDVTAELQALFDRTPDGGVAQLERDGDYRVEGMIVLRDRHDLTIEGNGARIFATTAGDDAGRNQIRILDGSGLKLRNLEIQGANPHAGLDERAYNEELEFQAAITIAGVTDVEIDRVNIHDAYGDLIFIDRFIETGRRTERVWIHDSTFARSGRQGIAVIDGRDIVIERNRFTDMRRATVDLEPASELAVHNVHILDNQVGPGRLLFVAAAGGGPVNRVVIARNRLHERPLTFWIEPPEGQRRRQFWVIDNTTNLTYGKAPLAFTRTDGVVVHGNRQLLAAGSALVAATDSCDIRVTENDTGPNTRALDGENRECGLQIPTQPPEPPPVAGRGQEQAAPPATTPPTTAAAPTTAATPTTQAPPTTTTTPATSSTSTEAPASLTAATTTPDDGVAVPVVVLAMVLSALAGAGGALAVSARRGRR